MPSRIPRSADHPARVRTLARRVRHRGARAASPTTRRQPPASACAVCGGRFLATDRGRALPIGRAHLDCADQIELGIADGACDPAEFWRIYGATMEAE